MTSGTEQKVLAALRRYDAHVRAGDIDGQVDFFADDWRSASGTTKAELRGQLERRASPDSRRRRVVLDDATVAIDGDEATVDPVRFRSPTGNGSFAFTMTREADGAWRCRCIERSRVADPPAETARELRERIVSDPHRPGYHFVMPEGVAMPFDPNGAIWWKGRYHLFHIFQDMTLGRNSDHWGHMSSRDLFHWRHHPTGLVNGMYSGNCFVNRDGVPAVCYHQHGLGNAMAVALDDDLDEWRKLDSNPITPPTEEGDEFHGRYRSWDPFGWVEGDACYAIFGGNRPAVAKAPALEGPWRYVGDLFAHDVPGVPPDEDVSCPDLFRLGEKWVLLCISHRLGCRYHVGEWKNEQFHAERHARMSWVDNSFFAPESLVDDRGRRIMWAWILDEPLFGVRAQQGWSGTLSLPRVLSLGDDGLLRYDLPEEIETLREDPRRVGPLTLPAGAETRLPGIAGDSLELIVEMGAEMEADGADQFGVCVRVSPDGSERTLIFFDASTNQLMLDTTESGPADTPKAVEAAPFELRPGEPLTLRIFVDRSVVEVFANRRQAIARRIYPTRRDSLGVSLFAVGGDVTVRSVRAWTMAPANST